MNFKFLIKPAHRTWFYVIGNIIPNLDALIFNSINQAFYSWKKNVESNSCNKLLVIWILQSDVRLVLWGANWSLYSQYAFLYIYANAKTYNRTQKQISKRKNKWSNAKINSQTQK